MSWYTYVYPTEGFDLSLSEDKLQELIDDDRKILDSLWERIIGICVANPFLYKKEDPIVHIIDMAKKYFDKYVEVSHRQNHNCFNQELVESIEYHKENPSTDETPFKPYLAYNHFEYTRSPLSGIEDTEKAVTKVKKYIVACSCAVPSDVIIQDKDASEHYNDSVEYITDKLEAEREWLDENIYKQDFCKILEKYYDTHEEN